MKGYDALKAGKHAYARSQHGSPNWQENLRLAKQKFEAAQSHLQDAQSLVDSNQHLTSELRDLNAYIEDCIKRSTF